MVRKTFLSLSLAAAVAALMFFQISKAGANSVTANVSALKSYVATTSTNTAKASDAEVASTLLFDSLKLNQLGLSQQALTYAYKGYQHLLDKKNLANDHILTICDFSQPSRNKRMYVIDVKNFKVLMNTYVAHGRNSGVDYATKFSNKPESLESSLGFYVTENTYSGKHGLSLKINGLEKGWNDNAEERAVVVHGAKYIGNQRLGCGFMGRSFGCPAVPQTDVAKLINIIKDGSCLFIYHPDEDYLHGSTILNG